MYVCMFFLNPITHGSRVFDVPLLGRLSMPTTTLCLAHPKPRSRAFSPKIYFSAIQKISPINGIIYVLCAMHIIYIHESLVFDTQKATANHNRLVVANAFAPIKFARSLESLRAAYIQKTTHSHTQTSKTIRRRTRSNIIIFGFASTKAANVYERPNNKDY